MIGQQCSENLSDHVHVAVHTYIPLVDGRTDNSADKETPPVQSKEGSLLKPKIKWDKCDKQMYSDILQSNLMRLEEH